MQVKNMSFMLDRLGQDCAPLQFLRELTQNALQSIQNLRPPKGEIIWDVDWNHHTLTDIYKLAVIDTGIGMTGEEMVVYINALSSSMNEQSETGNFGVGAKIAAAPRNHAGLVYLSWKAGVGYMIHLCAIPIRAFMDCANLRVPMEVSGTGRISKMTSSPMQSKTTERW